MQILVFVFVNVITFYVYSHPVKKNSCGKALNVLPNFLSLLTHLHLQFTLLGVVVTRFK